MRAENLIIALQKRREAMQADVFAKPPQDYESFVKLMGIWIGLGQALSEIENARKADYDE